MFNPSLSKGVPSLASKTLKRIRLFIPTQESLNLLAKNETTPSIANLVKHSSSKLEQVFYDRNSVLKDQGIELSRLAGCWMAIHGTNELPDNATASKYVGRDEVGEFLAKYIDDIQLGHFGAKGLSETRRCIAQSDKWRACNKFHITTREETGDERRMHGDIGVIRTVSNPDGSVETKEKVIATVDKELAEFARQYSWAFPGCS